MLLHNCKIVGEFAYCEITVASKSNSVPATGVPCDNTNETMVPTATAMPALGFCACTSPGGTNCEGAEPIAPGTRPSDSNRLTASVCVNPNKSGTVSGGKPEDTTTLTAEPEAAVSPPTGLCDMTLPAITVPLGSYVIVPITNPTPANRTGTTTAS